MADEKIRVRCEACGRQFRVSTDMAGKRARCPCGQVVSVPRPPSSDELARKWYYAREGQRYGPVPLSRLTALLQGGKVALTDYVWTKGMPNWRPAQEVEQFKDALAAAQAVGEHEAEQEPAAPAEAAEQPAPAPSPQPEEAAHAAAEEPVAREAPAAEEKEAVAAPPEPAAEEAAPAAAEEPVAREAPATGEEAVGEETRAEAPARPAPVSPQPTPQEEAAEVKKAPERPVRPKKEAAPKGPAAEPVATAKEKSYALTRALSLLLCVVGAVSALGGVVLVAWERIAAAGSGRTVLGPELILGGLVVLGVGHLLALARDAVRGISRLGSRAGQRADWPGQGE